MRSPETSASQPITGGPMRKPKKLMLDTMVMAMLAYSAQLANTNPGTK